MNEDNVKTFDKVAARIASGMKRGQPVTIQPNSKIEEAFTVVRGVVTGEFARRQKVRKNAGRPRRDPATLTKQSQYNRNYLDRKAAQANV